VVKILTEIMIKYIDKNMFEFEKVIIDNQPLIRSTFISYDSSMLQLPQVESYVTFMINIIR
ncbi:LysR family transcriptional regulator, partial [Staphylococcus haemolyticus]